MLVIILLLLIFVAILDEPHRVDGGRPRGILVRDQEKDLTAHPRSRTEELAVSILEKQTNAKFPSVNPSWLMYNGRTLELDAYNEEENIAMEVQGPLHTKFFPKVESYPSYYERLLRDEFKRATCRKKGVNLIVLDVAIPRHQWANYIQSRLFDFNKGKKPHTYLEEQHIAPYRNPYIETTLGLVGLPAVKADK